MITSKNTKDGILLFAVTRSLNIIGNYQRVVKADARDPDHLENLGLRQQLSIMVHASPTTKFALNAFPQHISMTFVDSARLSSNKKVRKVSKAGLQVTDQDAQHIAQPVLACYQIHGYKGSRDIERLQSFAVASIAVSAAWCCCLQLPQRMVSGES